jgi:hypothetical protein
MLELTHSEQIKEAKEKTHQIAWHTEPWMGMVRVSFGMYNTHEEVDLFINALNEIIDNREKYVKKYTINIHGDYTHKHFSFSSKDYFSLTKTIEREVL